MKLLTAVALAAAPFLWAAAANADIITSGGSSGTVSFTKLASGGLDFSTAGFTSSPAAFQSPSGTTVLTGTLTWGPIAAGVAGPESGGIFPVTSGGTETISYSASGNTFSGSVTWLGIKDGTTTPQFDDNAVLTISTSSGTNAAFLADFAPGSTAEIDFTVNLTRVTLAGLASGASTTGTFSSGEILPVPAPPPAVPEPASLTLLGSALVGLGWLGRRRRKSV